MSTHTAAKQTAKATALYKQEVTPAQHSSSVARIASKSKSMLFKIDWGSWQHESKCSSSKCLISTCYSIEFLVAELPSLKPLSSVTKVQNVQYDSTTGKLYEELGGSSSTSGLGGGGGGGSQGRNVLYSCDICTSPTEAPYHCKSETGR